MDNISTNMMHAAGLRPAASKVSMTTWQVNERFVWSQNFIGNIIITLISRGYVMLSWGVFVVRRQCATPEETCHKLKSRHYQVDKNATCQVTVIINEIIFIYMKIFKFLHTTRGPRSYGHPTRASLRCGGFLRMAKKWSFFCESPFVLLISQYLMD